MPGDNETNLQQTQQPKSVWAGHEDLKKHIQKMESSSTKAYSESALERDRMLSSILAQKTEAIDTFQGLGDYKLRQYHINTLTDTILSGDKQQKVTLDKNIARLNEESQKKRDREKAATSRLGNGHKYFEQSAAVLTTARTRMLTDAQEGRIQATVQNLNGDEFAMDPETGEMLLPIDELLKRRMELYKTVDNAKSMTLTGDDVLKAQYNQELLNKMDEAIKLWYQANGVDFETGKSVGSIRRKWARQEFALAMEAYRDTRKNMIQLLLQAKVKQLRKTPAYREKMHERVDMTHYHNQLVAESKENDYKVRTHEEELRPFTNKLELLPDMQDAVRDIRDLLREHPEQYQKNQKIIDKIYQECLQRMVAFTRKCNDHIVVQNLLQPSNGFQSMLHSEHLKQLNAEQTLGMQQINMFKDAISYFLDDKAETPFSVHIFLHDHYAITTDLYRQAGEDLQQVKAMKLEGKTDEEIKELRFREHQMKLAEQMRQEGKSELKIHDVLFHEEQKDRSRRAEERIVADVAVREKRMKDSGGDPGSDPEILRSKRYLDTLASDSFALNHMLIHLFKRDRIMSSPEAYATYQGKQRIYKDLLHQVENHKYQYKVKRADGTEYWSNRYGENNRTRDVASNITPLLSIGDCTDDKVMRSLDNIALLEKEEDSITARDEYALAEAEIEKLIQEKKLEEKDREAKLTERKEERYEERYIAALEEETELMRSSKAEIEAYMQEKDMANRAVGILSMEKLYQLTYDALPIFEKTQGLGYRAQFVTKAKSFHKLPTQTQKEFREFTIYYYALNDWTRQFLKQYTARTNINEDESESSYVLQPFSYYEEVRRRMFTPNQQESSHAAEATQLESQEQERLARQAEQERIQREHDAVIEETRRKNAELDAELITDYQLLMTQDQTRQDLLAVMQEKDQKTALEKAFAVLHAAAERLLPLQPKIKERYDEMAAHAFLTPIQPLRILIAENVADKQKAEEFFERTDHFAEQFKDLSYRELICYTVTRELPFILEPEFRAMPLLQDAANLYQERFQELVVTRQEKWVKFESEIASELGMQATTRDSAPHLLSDESPYKSYKSNREEIVNSFEARVDRMMEETGKYTTIPREGAERLVLAEIWEEKEAVRQQKQQHIFDLSQGGSVVPQADVEIWKKYGGASFHMQLPTEEAEKMIQISNGFLYAEEVREGVMELHPTLPETIRISVNGEEKELPLRRYYNLFTKAMAALLVDQNGNSIADPNEAYLSADFERLNTYTTDIQQWQALLQRGLKNLGNVENIEKTAKEIITAITAMKDKDDQFIAMPTELQRGFERVRSALGITGNDPGALAAHQERLETAMRAEGRPESEIEAYKRALVSFYNDTAAAREALADIRNMDENTKDVALPNACSANGNFIEQLNKAQGRDQQHLEYETQQHIDDHALEHVNYVLAHKDLFNAGLTAQDEQSFLNLKRKLEENPHATLTEAEKNFICGYTIKDAAKYIYHVAGNIGKDSEGRTLTLECFAAETKQAVVTPFLRHAAVGMYRNGQKGMSGYYNMDHPLPEGDDLILSRLKEDFILKTLPGDENYKSEE